MIECQESIAADEVDGSAALNRNTGLTKHNEKE